MQLEDVISNYRIIDLTHVLEERTPCYLPFYHIPWMSRKQGDGYNAYVLQIAEHHATHVDAPAHVGGTRWLDDVDLSNWHGPCRIINLKNKKLAEQVFTKDILLWEKNNGQINQGEIILLQYGWDQRWITNDDEIGKSKKKDYLQDFPGLSEEAAEYLAKKKIKLIGTDTPTVDSISAFLDAHDLGKTEPSHIKLLKEHNIPILEGLKNLDRLPLKGAYLFALPLNIKHGSGSPVRAVAFIPNNKT
ncbi:cyclase family protein [[Eubacterium] cellulosolvens]